MREIIAAKEPQNTAKPGLKAGPAVVENIASDAVLARLVVEFASRAGHDEKAREIYLPFLRAQHELASQAWHNSTAEQRHPSPS